MAVDVTITTRIGRSPADVFAALTAVELAWSGTVPLGTVLPAMLGTHLLIAAGEAVITVAAVSAVLSTRPDLLRRPVYA